MGALRILFVSSEVFPLAKTGGLADVSAALPAALAKLGVDVHLVMPAYFQVLERQSGKIRESIDLGDLLGVGGVRILNARMPDTGIPVWLVDCPGLFARSGGLYQDQHGNDWPDNALRFAVLCHAAQRLATGAAAEGFYADIVHANDWHTGLLPLLLAARPVPRPGTIFTVHNLAFQGVFPFEMAARLGLPSDDAAASMEFYGQISFLKAGLNKADRVTTVSPTYAREILTPEGGCGFDGLLRQRADKLTGILNGVDYSLWDPALDPHLPCSYRRASIAGKRVCKQRAQSVLGLATEPDTPLIAFLSRLTHQKMIDIVIEALPTLLRSHVQFALVGEGEKDFEEALQKLATHDAHRIAVRTKYDERLAHLLQAGADILLHPSRFEPCGLTPMYALRYGTLPVVRDVGGQADVVVDAQPDTLAHGTATGFSFRDPTVEGLSIAVDRALALYQRPVSWRRMQLQAMRQDFSWHQPAEKYLSLYQQLTGQGLEPAPVGCDDVGRHRVQPASNYKEEAATRLSEEVANGSERQSRPRRRRVGPSGRGA
jgi:starch synthase